MRRQLPPGCLPELAQGQSRPCRALPSSPSSPPVPSSRIHYFRRMPLPTLLRGPPDLAVAAAVRGPLWGWRCCPPPSYTGNWPHGTSRTRAMGTPGPPGSTLLPPHPLQTYTCWGAVPFKQGALRSPCIPVGWCVHVGMHVYMCMCVLGNLALEEHLPGLLLSPAQILECPSKAHVSSVPLPTPTPGP